MSSFIKTEPPWEKIPVAEYIKQMTQKHNELMGKLEELSGISFDTYKIVPTVMIEELKERYQDICNSYVRDYIIFGMERKACRKFVDYMTKYKGLTKDKAREQFWKIKEQ